jgi:predicted amidohydrolase YtcJ
MDGRHGTDEERPKIFSARNVITMAGGDGVGAFAVIGERIVASGADHDLRTRFPGAERVDFADATIVPGFNDAHMHLAMTAEDLLHVDLFAKAVPSIAALKSRLRTEVERTPPGGWIRGSRYDDTKMAEGRVLTRGDLDEVSREIPILVVHIACHWGVVNSKALELAGIDERSPSPEGGKLGRDATGRLNGILYEQALFHMAYPVASSRGTSVAPASTFEERIEGLGRAVRMFHEAGLTSVGDAFAGPADLALFQEGRRRGILTLRVNMLLGYAHYDHVRKLGLRSGFGDEHLRINGVKALVDGAIGGRTCLMEQPFEGTADDYGIQTISTNDLRDVVNMVHEDGTRIGVHANGDRAISLLLDLLEAAELKHPRPWLRHRIEHCTIINETILARMKRLGAIAVPFGNYVNYHGGRLLDWYGPQRVKRMFACRSFLDAGIAVAGSSDYPCSPFEPLEAFQSCVTRRGWDGPLIGENQRITPLEALGLYTTGAAYATGEEHIKGRLVPGFLADFVVLDRNPLTTDAGALSSIRVLETWAGGKRVFRRD